MISQHIEEIFNKYSMSKNFTILLPIGLAILFIYKISYGIGKFVYHILH